MAGSSEDSFVEPLGYMMLLTAVIALILSYAKQSTIVAFIAAGASINAAFGGEIVDTEVLGHFSEVGILVLLFMAGLEVELDAFMKSWKTVTIIGMGQIVVCTACSAFLSLAVLPAVGSKNVGSSAAVYFGLCMTFSSTILVLGYLKSSKSMSTVYGQLCLGTLVLQDAASVLGLAVLGGLTSPSGGCRQAKPADCSIATSLKECLSISGCLFQNNTQRLLASASVSETSTNNCVDACVPLGATECTTFNNTYLTSASSGAVCTFVESGGSSIALNITLLFGKLIAACFILAILEKFVLGRLFESFAKSLELLYIGTLGYTFGCAAVAVSAGFSAEITAFLAGVSIAQLPYKIHIEAKMESIKSLGVEIFFLALGLQLNIDQQALSALPIAVCLCAFKLFLMLPLFMALGYCARLKSHNCFMLGILMNQISEFSLILCTISVRSGVLDPIVLTVMTLAAVLSIIVSSIGHIFAEQMYTKAKAGVCFRCLKSIDAHYHQAHHKNMVSRNSTKATKEIELSENKSNGDHGRDSRVNSLDISPPPGWMSNDGNIDWTFEDQLKDRSTEQLGTDLRKVEKELEKARESMSITAEDKKKHHAPQLYAAVGTEDHKIATSQNIDIVHGIIEGYVVVDHQLMFCTLRSGRMLFWKDQHDVGHTPPVSVWDISGMQMIDAERERTKKKQKDRQKKLRKDRTSNLLRALSTASFNEAKKDEDSEFKRLDNSGETVTGATLDIDIVEIEDDYESSSEEEEEGDIHPWEWTIVLAHNHRTSHATEAESDPMKLRFHGLEDHSDHDLQDWQDALSVACTILNPIALRRAHIKEELTLRHKALKTSQESQPISVNASDVKSTKRDSVIQRMEAHGHRNQIICLGYNEMFPAVLSLADTTGKDVVVVEYDPQKINTVKSHYSLAQRQEHLREKSKNSAASKINAGISTIDQDAPDPSLVECVYADIHDPESWEELEMDEAFMIVCTMKGARHAEKAICKWLKKHRSETIFIACTSNNTDAMQLYAAGAHFVLQTDALAMRSTREIFMETIAQVGDCSELVVAGAAHARRLQRLESSDPLRFLYETG